MTIDGKVINLRESNIGFEKFFNRMANSGGPFERWDEVLNELIGKWYLNLTREETYVLKEIVYIVHDVGFTAASCRELVTRILLPKSGLLKNASQIQQIINSLIKRGVIKPIMTGYLVGHPGKQLRTRKSKHLLLGESFKLEALNALAEVSALCIRQLLVKEVPGMD